MEMLHAVSSHFQAGKVTSISGGKKKHVLLFWLFLNKCNRLCLSCFALASDLNVNPNSGCAGVYAARWREHVSLWPRGGVEKLLSSDASDTLFWFRWERTKAEAIDFSKQPGAVCPWNFFLLKLSPSIQHVLPSQCSSLWHVLFFFSSSGDPGHFFFRQGLFVAVRHFRGG